MSNSQKAFFTLQKVMVEICHNNFTKHKEDRNNSETAHWFKKISTRDEHWMRIPSPVYIYLMCEAYGFKVLHQWKGVLSPTWGMPVSFFVDIQMPVKVLSPHPICTSAQISWATKPCVQLRIQHLGRHSSGPSSSRAN